MSETTREERDRARRHMAPPDHDKPGVLTRALNDADRLAAIERQVLWRTEDMPQYAKAWIRYYPSGGKPQAAWLLIDQSGTEQWKPAPKERPDGRPGTGPLFLPILDGDKNE